MSNPTDVVKQIKNAARRKFSADDKIRIVLEGLAASIYYKWSKEFLEAGKNGLTRSIIRDATSDEVRRLKDENGDLKKSCR